MRSIHRLAFCCLLITGGLGGGVLLPLALGAGQAGATSQTWAVVATPNETTTMDDGFEGVSCPTTSFCMAIGYYDYSTGTDTLSETWNGSSWTIVLPQNQGGSQDELDSVSCTSSSFCLASGDQDGAGFSETWNGSSWSAPLSTGIPGGGKVSCTSSSFCMAVSSSNGSPAATIADKWNGSSWASVPSQNPGSSDNYFDGVSCIGTSFCAAVGDYVSGSGDETLGETWTGTSFTANSSENPGTGANTFGGVSCTSATFCEAAGRWNNGNSGLDNTLAEVWNGSNWKTQTTPNQTSTYNDFDGVSCASTSSCSAVGYDGVPGGDGSLAESYNGSSWALDTTPNPGSGGDDFFAAVSCPSVPSVQGCIGAGQYIPSSGTQTFVETNIAAPVVSQVSPFTGLETGEAPVTITGSNFTGATAVYFGTTLASFTVTNDNSISATSPSTLEAGTVDVTVVTPAGTSTVHAADHFTYTAQNGPSTVPCNPTCTNTESSALNSTTVSVTGNSGTTTSASTTITTNTATLSCGASFDYPAAVSDVSSAGFKSGELLTIEEKVEGIPSTKGVKVCLEPSGATKAAFLHHCHHDDANAPCFVSIVEQAGNAGVTATFLTEANDPRFWTGSSAVVPKMFTPTSGPAGTAVTINGKNMNQVTSAVVGGVTAKIESQTSKELVFAVPSGAVSSQISLNSDTGTETSKTEFDVT